MRLRTPFRGRGEDDFEGPGLLVAGLHLLVLCSFAFAQPLFDLLARSPEFFVVRGSTRADIIVFAVGLTLLPPLVLLLAEAVAGVLDRRLRLGLHLLFVAALTGVIALQVLRRIDAPTTLVLLLAAAVGAAAALAYARVAPVRSVVSVLGPAPLVFLGLLLLHSPVSRLTIEGEAHARAAEDVAAQAPVVFVVMDEFPTVSLMRRDGRIDAERYPNFAELAAGSTWYRNATTVHEHTTEAVPSMLTGMYPGDGQLPFALDHPDNLFTLLGGSYRLKVTEPVTRLCPARLCSRTDAGFGERMESLTSDLSVVWAHLVVPRRMTDRLPAVDQNWTNFRGDPEQRLTDEQKAKAKAAIDHLVGPELEKSRAGEFGAFVSSFDRSAEPTLYYTHILLPHSPWARLPSGKYYDRTEILGLHIDTWWEDEWLVRQGWQRHLMQVAYTDRLVGAMLDRLRALDLYDRSLIVMVADHGVSFRPGERRRGITETNLHDIAFVPLFVKAPGQEDGAVVDRHVQTVDIVPTIVDVLGIDLPWEPEGQSLLEPGEERPQVVLSGREGNTLSAPFDELLARREATLAEMVGLFGEGDEEPGLWAFGPHEELLGRSTAGAGEADGGPTVELDGEELFADYDPAAQLSPAHLTGRVADAPPGDPLELAIAVNGRVAATCRTYEQDGEVRLSAFVPPAALEPGANEVEVLRIVSGAGGVTLERLVDG